MQAIYRADGKITDVYDEKLHRHNGLLTIDLTSDQADNIDKYRVNPNDVSLYLVPTCDRRYTKIIDNVIIEMTQPEKDFVDLPPEYKKLIDGVFVEMTEEEKRLKDEQILSDVAKALLRDIDFKSIRSIREYISAKPDAPLILKDYEAEAVEKRKKVKN